MIIVRFKGGLGNQMFQYAAARALALRNAQVLKMDLASGFASDPYHRRFCLSAFSVPITAATRSEIWRVKAKSIIRTKRLQRAESTRIQKQGVYYSPELSDTAITGDLYLDGYWQSEQYFKSIQSLIRAEFLRTLPLGPKANVYADQIQTSHCIGIHFRQKNFPVTCPREYYSQALSLVSQIVHPARVFLFTDDSAWVSHNFESTVPQTIISLDGPNADIEEFCLLTMCKHFIIANSTFSWWAAWLGTTPESTIVAPARLWNTRYSPVQGLLPDSWTLI